MKKLFLALAILVVFLHILGTFNIYQVIIIMFPIMVGLFIAKIKTKLK